MTAKKKIEAVEHECREEGRRAHLLVETVEEDGRKRVTGVQCDNPKLQSLDQWECEWSCVDEVAESVEQESDKA